LAGFIERRLAERGIVLPEPPRPAASYVPAVLTGNLLFVSGQLSRVAGADISGKLGADLGLSEGRHGARLAALNVLAHALTALGDLDRITRVVRLSGYVNVTPDFIDMPSVVNGASDLFGEIFGPAGAHSRIAVGVASLPFGVAVEIDAVFEVAPS